MSLSWYYWSCILHVVALNCSLETVLWRTTELHCRADRPCCLHLPAICSFIFYLFSSKFPFIELHEIKLPVSFCQLCRGCSRLVCINFIGIVNGQNQLWFVSVHAPRHGRSINPYSWSIKVAGSEGAGGGTYEKTQIVTLVQPEVKLRLRPHLTGIVWRWSSIVTNWNKPGLTGNFASWDTPLSFTLYSFWWCFMHTWGYNTP